MTITPADLKPGDLFFGPIGGIVPGIFPVGLGQLLLADRRARLSWRRWRKIRHAGVIVQASERKHLRDLPNGDLLNYEGSSADTRPRLVQAMPRGAEEIEMTTKHWTPEYVYIRPAYGSTYEQDDLSDFSAYEQGQAVAQAARGYVGTPYNFLTYGAMASRKLGFMLTDHVLRQWISTRKDMMCSQLDDQSLADAGFHVFDDGRLPQDVVPAELFRALLDMPGTKYTIAGMGEWMDGPRFWRREELRSIQ